MDDRIEDMRREIDSLRVSIRQAESLVRLMQSQVLNYEEVDDTRRALLEHLLAERQTLNAERSGATEHTKHRVQQLEKENDELRGQAEQEDAAAEAGRELEAALEEEQRRGGDIEQKLNAARDAHEAAIEEQQQLVETLQGQIDEERGQAEEVKERWRVIEESDRARAENLVSKVETLRAELERSQQVDEGRTRELLAEIERARSTAAELSSTADRLRAKLTTLRDASTRVRTKIQDKERLVALASPDSGTADHGLGEVLADAGHPPAEGPAETPVRGDEGEAPAAAREEAGGDEAEASAAQRDEAEAPAAERDEAEAPPAERDKAEASAAERDEAEAPAAERDEAEASAAQRDEAEAPAAERDEAEVSAAERDEPEAPAAQRDEAEAPAAERDEAKAPEKEIDDEAGDSDESPRPGLAPPPEIPEPRAAQPGADGYDLEPEAPPELPDPDEVDGTRADDSDDTDKFAALDDAPQDTDRFEALAPTDLLSETAEPDALSFSSERSPRQPEPERPFSGTPALRAAGATDQGEDSKRSFAERAASLDDLPAAATPDEPERTYDDLPAQVPDQPSAASTPAPDGRVSLEEFRTRLDDGCRVLRTERFRQVMLADRPSLVISSLLERTERSEEISALAPPAIRRNLAAWLFRMYGRGMIELADEE